MGTPDDRIGRRKLLLIGAAAFAALLALTAALIARLLRHIPPTGHGAWPVSTHSARGRWASGAIRRPTFLGVPRRAGYAACGSIVLDTRSRDGTHECGDGVVCCAPARAPDPRGAQSTAACPSRRSIGSVGSGDRERTGAATSTGSGEAACRGGRSGSGTRGRGRERSAVSACSWWPTLGPDWRDRRGARSAGRAEPRSNGGDRFDDAALRAGAVGRSARPVGER